MLAESAVYKWIAGGLGSLVLVMAGGFLGDWKASTQYYELAADLKSDISAIRNELRTPNPVVVANLESQERRDEEIVARLDRIEYRLDQIRDGQ